MLRDIETLSLTWSTVSNFSQNWLYFPNSGAAQADAALLVINATRGEFESGYDQGGQTREHAILLRSMGVQKMLVAVNKMDTVDWSKERFDEIQETIGTFLKKQAGFGKRFNEVCSLNAYV